MAIHRDEIARNGQDMRFLDSNISNLAWFYVRSNYQKKKKREIKTQFIKRYFKDNIAD